MAYLKAAIRKAEKLVSKCEAKERVALFDYHDWLEWMRCGWKAAKSKTHHCNENCIVVAAVVAFVDPMVCKVFAW
jgi:hypothetical protein